MSENAELKGILGCSCVGCIFAYGLFVFTLWIIGLIF